jgi:hypothetical protein
VPIYLSLISSAEQAFAWTDPGGTRHALGVGGTGYDVKTGIRGRWFPPMTPVEDSVPYIPGAVLRDVNVGTLDFPVPLLISGDTPAQLRQRLRDAMYWFSPGRGDGIFECTGPDGITRLLNCRVREIDVIEDWPQQSYLTQDVILSLHAADPYYYADEATVETFTVNIGEPEPFLHPGGFFPLHLSSNVFFAGPTIDNPGQVESWPTWTIRGPGTNPSLRNATTGEVMTFGRTLGAGEMIVVALSRAGATITDGLGTRLYSTLSNPSTVWAIQPGINRVQIGMSGATSASSVTLTYTPRYLGP